VTGITGRINSLPGGSASFSYKLPVTTQTARRILMPGIIEIARPIGFHYWEVRKPGNLVQLLQSLRYRSTLFLEDFWIRVAVEIPDRSNPGTGLLKGGTGWV